MFVYILATSLVVMLASLVGVVAVWKQAGTFIEKNLGFLVSFAAGVFLFVSYSLSLEVIEHADSVGAGLMWIILGALAVLVVFKFLPHFHHHHDEKEEGEHVHSVIDARRILLSDGLHNVGDGILIAASFAVSPVVGLIAGVSILVHELVQEVSEFFVLRQAGLSVKKALLTNFVISGTILVGALGGYFLLENFEVLELPLLGLAAGSFLIVVVHDLIPHSVRSSETKTHYLKHAGWFFAGLVLMFVVGLFAGHGEVGHGSVDDDHMYEGDIHDELDQGHDESRT